MAADFSQISWDAATELAAQTLIRLALQEDLDHQTDLTSQCVADGGGQATASFVSRGTGVVAGLPILPLVATEAGAAIEVELLAADGDSVAPGDAVATMSGPAIDLLTCERTMLNFLCRLSGVATLASRFVDEVAGQAAIYDTRKTTPGWRRLEKYAVGCGGGHNHRTGLYDAVLIKDNHLAHAASAGVTPADAVRSARQQAPAGTVIEVEVDSLDQLEQVLPARPDIVLLDNMSNEQLRRAVGVRDSGHAGVVLEASGGVNLQTVAGIAASGVDRISVGALTHSSGSFDFGLDWGRI
ncbi:Nicotinate-nucleotide pyrophosphorylase [carboxylating] [Posidoniimonas polymericola]|uniref:Probable nicotinate-nucleotide pyrophosphorylase [carboxylating] n=1 Tax=Posidoniimonas polymericola TaxID=2528002 RepID=A0A5C5ZGK6_9BACT|nr:carboxylating nicotinate-nucleotide diphosphorylase [Posidoniimonas polymericola]TWT85693.1 Nicotinate-nucleotide pyrophosphorylase [carboxylating] [Posidoniimonas polymericola]